MSRVKALHLGYALAVLVSVVLFAEGQWTQDTWGLGSGDNSLNTLAMYGRDVPGARGGSFSAKTLDSQGNEVMRLFGGWGASWWSEQGALNDMWQWRVGAKVWDWHGLQGTNLLNTPSSYGPKGNFSSGSWPGGRCEGASWSDPAGTMWIYGGWGLAGANAVGLLNDIWRWNETAKQWAYINGSRNIDESPTFNTDVVQPGGRADIGYAADPEGNLYIFGGYTVMSGSQWPLNNDVWSYNITSGNWTRIYPGCIVANWGTKGITSASNCPPVLGVPSMLFHQNKLYIVGGIGRDSNLIDNTYYHNSMWTFDLTTKQWTWISGDRQEMPGIYDNGSTKKRLQTQDDELKKFARSLESIESESAFAPDGTPIADPVAVPMAIPAVPIAEPQVEPSSVPSSAPSSAPSSVPDAAPTSTTPTAAPDTPVIMVGRAEILALSTTEINLDTDSSNFIEFEQFNATHVQVTVSITGIINNPDSLHGIHVHTYGDISDPTGASLGAHWDPTTTPHGCSPESRSAGDLGNWQATGGAINQVKILDGISLSGPDSIIGRGVVLHNNTDDCATVASSGARLAAGVIGVANVAGNTAAAGVTAGPFTAVCNLMPTTSGAVAGHTLGTSFIFTQNAAGDPVRVIGNLARQMVYGVHVHQFGDLSDRTGATKTGGHFDPLGTGFHDWPGSSAPHHAGDMGNTTLDHIINGKLWFVGQYNTMTISQTASIESIVGRGFIVHADPDQGPTQQPTGAAGARHCQCVIGIASPTLTKVPTTIPSVPMGPAHPGSRHSAVFTYAPSTGLMYLAFGWGRDGANVTGNLNDLFSFDPTTQVWTWVSGNDSIYFPVSYKTPGIAAGRGLPGAWVDSYSNLWYAFGYYSAIGSTDDFRNDMWSYSLAGPLAPSAPFWQIPTPPPVQPLPSPPTTPVVNPPNLKPHEPVVASLCGPSPGAGWVCIGEEKWAYQSDFTVPEDFVVPAGAIAMVYGNIVLPTGRNILFQTDSKIVTSGSLSLFGSVSIQLEMETLHDIMKYDKDSSKRLVQLVVHREAPPNKRQAPDSVDEASQVDGSSNQAVNAATEEGQTVDTVLKKNFFRAPLNASPLQLDTAKRDARIRRETIRSDSSSQREIQVQNQENIVSAKDPKIASSSTKKYVTVEIKQDSGVRRAVNTNAKSGKNYVVNNKCASFTTQIEDTYYSGDVYHLYARVDHINTSCASLWWVALLIVIAALIIILVGTMCVLQYGFKRSIWNGFARMDDNQGQLPETDPADAAVASGAAASRSGRVARGDPVIDISEISIRDDDESNDGPYAPPTESEMEGSEEASEEYSEEEDSEEEDSEEEESEY